MDHTVSSDEEEQVIVKRKRIRKPCDDHDYSEGEGISGGEADPEEIRTSSDEGDEESSEGEDEWENSDDDVPSSSSSTT